MVSHLRMLLDIALPDPNGSRGAGGLQFLAEEHSGERWSAAAGKCVDDSATVDRHKLGVDQPAGDEFGCKTVSLYIPMGVSLPIERTLSLFELV